MIAGILGDSVILSYSLVWNSWKWDKAWATGLSRWIWVVPGVPGITAGFLQIWGLCNEKHLIRHEKCPLFVQQEIETQASCNDQEHLPFTSQPTTLRCGCFLSAHVCLWLCVRTCRHIWHQMASRIIPDFGNCAKPQRFSVPIATGHCTGIGVVLPLIWLWSALSVAN